MMKKFFIILYLFLCEWLMLSIFANDDVLNSGKGSVDQGIKQSDTNLFEIFKNVLVVPDVKTEGAFVQFTPIEYDHYLVYFSAHWCVPCQKFTPKLIQFYVDNQLVNGKIQLIFVSKDQDINAMWKYMTQLNMPWPAVDFNKALSVNFLNSIQGPGIPDLVLVDKMGKVLASSHRGEKYLGTDSVLEYVSTELLKK